MFYCVFASWLHFISFSLVFFTFFKIFFCLFFYFPISKFYHNLRDPKEKKSGKLYKFVKIASWIFKMTISEFVYRRLGWNCVLLYQVRCEKSVVWIIRPPNWWAEFEKPRKRTSSKIERKSLSKNQESFISKNACLIYNNMYIYTPLIPM